MDYIARLIGVNNEELARVAVSHPGNEPAPRFQIPYITTLRAMFRFGDDALDPPTRPQVGKVVFKYNGEQYNLGDGLICIYVFDRKEDPPNETT